MPGKAVAGGQEPQFKARSPGLSARTLSSSLCPPATGWLPSPPRLGYLGETALIQIAAEISHKAITGRSSQIFRKARPALPLATDCHARTHHKVPLQEGETARQGMLTKQTGLYAPLLPLQGIQLAEREAPKGLQCGIST